MITKIIVIFFDYDSNIVKRAVTYENDRACINPVRVINELFNIALYQSERSQVYSASFAWENGPKLIDVFDYVPLADVKGNWKYLESYIPTA